MVQLLSNEHISEKSKDREFQLAMLVVQLKHGSQVSFLTTSMAVVISFAVTVIALSFSSFYSNLPPETKLANSLNFGLMTLILAIAFVFLGIEFLVNSRRTARELRSLQERYVEPEIAEKSKQEAKA